MAGHGSRRRKGQLERLLEEPVSNAQGLPLAKLLEENRLIESILRLLEVPDDPRLEERQLALLVTIQPQVSPDVYAGKIELRCGEVTNEITTHALRPADGVIPRALLRAGT